VIDFPGNYRQYFSPPRHVTIHGLSEAVEAHRVSEARHLKGKLVFKVRRVAPAGMISMMIGMSSQRER